MASRRSVALFSDIATIPQSRSRTLLLHTGSSRACTCSYTTARASSSSSWSSTASSSSSETAAAEVEADDIRTQILKASLPFIPEHGFTLKSIQEGLSSLRSLPTTSTSSPLSSFASSTPSHMFLEQLFPRNPARRKHGLREIRKSIQRRDIFKSAETPLPMDDAEGHMKEELEGPRRALYEAWAENALKVMERNDGNAAGAAPSSPGTNKKTVLELLQKRLELNVPVIQHLPAALSTLARFDPSQPSLSTFRPYLSHVGHIAKQIKTVSGSTISTPRLATVYSLSEFYQLSQKSHPDIIAVLNYTNDLLKSTEKYDGLIRDSVGFAGYALQSWRNIFHARGL